MKSSPLKKVKTQVAIEMFSQDEQSLQAFAKACVMTAQHYLAENKGSSANAWRQACAALFANYAVQITKVNLNQQDNNPLKEAEGEYIELTNQGPDVIDIGGWRILSAAKQQFVFAKPQLLKPNEVIRIYSLDKGEYSFKSDQALWSKQGERASVEDAQGNLISRWVFTAANAPQSGTTACTETQEGEQEQLAKPAAKKGILPRFFSLFSLLWRWMKKRL